MSKFENITFFALRTEWSKNKRPKSSLPSILVPPLSNVVLALERPPANYKDEMFFRQGEKDRYVCLGPFQWAQHAALTCSPNGA